MLLLLESISEPPVFSDLVVAHGQLLPELHVRGCYWFVVKVPEHQLSLVVAIVHEHPHPLANTKLLVLGLYFDVVAFSILAHCFG
jgi:hypothetical protein